jgi:hypothetical protein
MGLKKRLLNGARCIEKADVRRKSSVDPSRRILVPQLQFANTFSLLPLSLSLIVLSLPPLTLLLSLSFPTPIVSPRLHPCARQRASDGDDWRAKGDLTRRQEHDLGGYGDAARRSGGAALARIREVPARRCSDRSIAATSAAASADSSAACCAVASWARITDHCGGRDGAVGRAGEPSRGLPRAGRRPPS